MIIYESKLEGTQAQYEKLDAAIRTGRFVRNSIIRAWIDNQIKNRSKQPRSKDTGLQQTLLKPCLPA